MWFLVALFVVSLAASLLLTPKPQIENARASGFDDLQYPRAEQGSPVPLIFGRARMKGPNTLWAGDFTAVPIKKKQKTGLFSSKTVIIGYTYYVGLQLGLALGRCTLHTIWSDKDILWSGTANTDGQAININLPNLFGGKEKGGGFVGTLRFYTGSFTQAINAYMESKIGSGLVPAYRGTCHIVFEHPNIGESNQLRTLSFELSNYTDGLASGVGTIGEDMNPMELLYQAFCLDWGGLDVSPDMLDLENLREVATVLHAEGNGMSLCIASPNAGKEIAGEVMRQIDGLMYQNPATGKIRVKLIRNDYDVNDLPVFDESNILSVRNFTSKLWEDTKNQVRVTYTDADNKYVKGSAMVQDLANINAQGRVRSITNAYPGITKGDLATEVANRDLTQASVPLMSALIELNREGAQLRPGDVFVWAWSPYRITQSIMRVKTFDLGALSDGRIVVECTQDDFGVNLTVFAPPQGSGSGPVAPTTPATAATVRLVRECAYWFAQASGITLQSSKSLLLVGAQATAGANQYDIYTSTDTTNYNESEQGVVYTPFGTLAGTVSSVAGLTTGVISSITINTTDGAELEANTAAAIAQGAGMFMIDSELFAYETVSLGTGTATLGNVRRALLDTVPAAHSIGAGVFFIQGDSVIDDQFAWDATVRVKVLPTTYSDTLDLASAPYDSVALQKRAARPLRPANVKFDGGSAFTPPSVGTGSKTVTWANRSRLSATILSIADNTNEYEPNQQTVFRYRKNGGAWVSATLAPGVTSYTFDAGAAGGDTVDYEIYATRDGLDSFSVWSFTAGTAAATGTNPDTGGSAPPDTTPPYVPPVSTATDAITASEALSANDLVNIHNVSGNFRVRKADAATGREAHGYVRAAFASGAVAEIYFDGVNEGLTGLAPGPKYLGAAGAITDTVPSTSGYIVQRVGVASASGSFVFEPGEAVGLA